ncbi:transporter [Thiorhodovibrio winogradskyi]|nr:AEC family transporter [Thiorhodovibrio winogradskyi]MBK5969840.1 transporter [Thiorhodovibrio winogradskyi]
MRHLRWSVPSRVIFCQRVTVIVIARLLDIIVPVYGIVLVGFLYARRHAPDLRAANRLNLDIFTPALLFDVLAAKTFHPGAYLLLGLSGTLVVLGSGLIAWGASRVLGMQARTLVPPMMFLNSGNMGLPLAVLAFGEPALGAAVVLFMVENLLHFTLGVRILDRHLRFSELARMPLVLACVLGILASLTELRPPPAIGEGIHLLGQIAIPLMLFALGARLTEADLTHWRAGLLGALLRPVSGLLLAMPLLWLLPLPPAQQGLLVLFAALPPAVLNYLFAERYDQQPQVVAAIVIWGNLASLLVIPAVLALVLP